MLGKFLPSSELHRRGLIVAGGTLLAQAIQAVGTPLLGHYYAPAVFGVWSVLQSTTGLSSAISGLRYELAIVVAESDEEAACVAAVQFASSLAVCLITLLPSILYRDQLAVLLGAPELGCWLPFVPLLVVLSSATSAASNWMVRFRQFSMLSAFRIAQGAGGTGAQWALAPLTSSSPTGMISGGILGIALPILIASPRVAVQQGALFRRGVSWVGFRAAARKFRRFPLYVVPFGLATVLRERGLVMLLSSLAGTQVVGLFAVALRLAYLPVQLISGSLSPVVFERLSADPVGRGKLILGINRAVAMLVIPGFAYLACYAPELVSALMGERWRQSGVFAGIFAVPAGIMLLSVPVDRFFDVVGKQHVSLIIECSHTLIALLLVGGSILLGMSTTTTLVLYAACNVLYQATWLVGVYYYCAITWTAVLRAASLPALILAISTITLLACRWLLPGFAGMLVAGILVVGFYSHSVFRKGAVASPK